MRITPMSSSDCWRRKTPFDVRTVITIRGGFFAAHTPEWKIAMFKQKLKVLLVGVVVACAFGAIDLKVALADPATQTTRLVVDFFDPTVVLGVSTLTRTDNGITMHLTAYDLPAGAYSAWLPIFQPGGMMPIAAGRVGGHVIGEGGTLNIAVHLKEGEIIEGHPMFPAGAVQDARLQDIGMVIRYHGPAEPGFIYEQTHTFEPDIAVDALRTRHNAP
jgi:hypothetical protein